MSFTRDPKPCGSDAAYQRHRYYHQVPCDACTEAHQEDTARRGGRRPRPTRLTHTPAADHDSVGADLRELIRLVALVVSEHDRKQAAERQRRSRQARMSRRNKDQGRLAAEDAVSVGDRAPGEPRAGSRIRSGSRVGNPGANPGPGTDFPGPGGQPDGHKAPRPSHPAAYGTRAGDAP